MHKKYQRGELSLFRAAVFIGVVTLAAMLFLMSARRERNYFSDAWKRITGVYAVQAAKVTGAANRPIRKCMVGGKSVYSNVECDAADPASRQLEFYDPKGVEPPKAAPAAAE